MTAARAAWAAPVSALAMALSLAVSLPARAAVDGLDLALSLRGDVWSGSRRLDDRGAIVRSSAWGRAKADLGDAGGLVGDGWLAAQDRDADGVRRAQLRELYWRGSAGRWAWKLGRQTVVWGRADGLNPTDNLSPRDYTLLVPEDNEQRRGNDGAQLGVEAGGGTFSVIGFVRAASHTIPLEPLAQTRYAVAAPPHRPQWALKYERAGEGVDGSVSYFEGTDPVPDLSLAGADASGVRVAVGNHPLRVLGADISLTRQGVVWRAEAAWLQPASRGSDDFERKRPRLWLVAGGEWTLGAGTTLGVELSAQRVGDYRSPDTIASPLVREVAWRQASVANETAATQFGVVWRLARRWLNDTLTAEASGVVMSGPRSSLWRTRISYAIDDHLQLLAGTDASFGPQHSLWGQLRDNRLAYAQLRYGW